MDVLATRALIVASQALSRIGLASLPRLEAQFIEIMEASSLEGLVGIMTASVGLLVIDSDMFNWGLPFLRSIKSSSPQAKFILLTEDGDREAVIEALSSGADGVIPKSSSGDEIRFALKRVLGGDVYVPPLHSFARNLLQGAALRSTPAAKGAHGPPMGSDALRLGRFTPTKKWRGSSAFRKAPPRSTSEGRAINWALRIVCDGEVVETASLI